MKILLASGDHHTSGSNPYSNVEFDGSHVWAKYISRELGLKYLNVAKPGAGTEEVSMHTIMCVHNLLNKYNEDPSNIFVAVLWGVNNNKHLFWDGEDFRSYGIGSTIEVSEDVKKFVEYKTKVDSGGYDSYRDLYNIYVTAIALERYNIKYQFMNTSAIKQPEDEKLTGLFNVIRRLYGERAEKHYGLFNDADSFDGYLKTVAEPIAYGANNYPYWGAESHEKYANFILERL